MDLGKDLIVEETRAGLIESTKIKWLVSCKHFSFTGQSVTPSDEKNVRERVHAARCDGFLGFYSTLPSSGLTELLHNQSDIQVNFLDHEVIERHLLASKEGRKLVDRYFPKSAKKLAHTPAEVYDGVQPIQCDNCGKDLLAPPSGIWVPWDTGTNSGSKGRDHYVDMYFSCKNECDHILKERTRVRHASLGFIYGGWDDIPDLCIPTVFMVKVIAVLNGLAAGEKYEPRAFEKLKHLLLATFPHVSRHLTDKDRERIDGLQRIPSYLGGLG